MPLASHVRNLDLRSSPQVLRAATLAGRWRRSALPATLSSVPEEQQLAPAGSLHDPATRGTPERPPHGSASRSKTAVQAIRAAVLSALVPARRPTEAPDGGPSVPDGSTRSAVTIDDVPTRISPLPEDETGDAGASSPHEPAARPLGLPGTAGDTETQPVIAGDTRTPSVIAGDTKTPSVAADDTRTPPDTAGEPPAPAPAASRASHTKLPPVRAHGGPLPADKAHSPKPADSVDPVNPGDRVDPVDIADPVASVAPVDPAVDLLRQSETYTRALIEGAAAAAESLCETLASPAIAGLAAAARHSPATSAAVLLLCTPVPSVEEVMGAVAADAKAKRGEHPREGVEGDVGAEEKAVETETGDAGAEEQDKAKRKEGALSAFGRLLAAVSQGLAGLPPALLARGGRLLEALTEALGKGREQLLAVLQHASDEDMAMLSALGGDIGKAASALAGMCGGDVGEVRWPLSLGAIALSRSWFASLVPRMRVRAP